MGIKIIKSVFVISFLFFGASGSTQNIDKKKEYIKKYAYCNCIYINNVKLDIKYLNDKFQASDKSSNEFIDLGKITESEQEKILNFTEKMTCFFSQIESEYYSESGNSNTITSKCLEFYESKELDNFSRKFLNIKVRKKNNVR